MIILVAQFYNKSS